MKTKHIAVLGANGRTGRQVVEQALQQGHSVTAVVRNAESMKNIQHELLHVREANPLDAVALASCLKGVDAVVSCIGAKYWSQYLPWSSVSIYSESAKSACEAMREAGVSRYVGMAGTCLKYGPDQPKAITYVFKPLFRGIARDMSRMEDYFQAKENSDINFTIVKPNHLQDTPMTEAEIFAAEGQWCDGCVMSRADVARFMLDTLSNDQWDRKLVAIKTEKDKKECSHDEKEEKKVPL
jgi:putative NADH-flavin reductase